MKEPAGAGTREVVAAEETPVAPAGPWRDRLRPGSSLFALFLTAASLLLWCAYAERQDCHVYRDLSCGTYTDHFSHMNTGRLFTKVGIDIWRKPLRDNGRALTPQEIAALPRDIRVASPDDMRTFDGWPAGKPFLSSWNANPRLHPPGDMLLTAPVALLYSFTSLSFSGANTLLILLFLLYVHIPIYLLLRTFGPPRARAPAGLLIGAVVYLELVHWALEGFYEGGLVAPLLLSAVALHRRNGTASLFWYSVAAVLHFRAFFLAPWAVCALYLVVKQREWSSWGRRGVATAAGTAVLSLASIGPFVLLLPVLRTMPVSNGLNPGHPDFHFWKIAALLLLVAGGVVAFALARSWLDVAVTLWLGLVALQLHETLAWDMLTLLAWLLAPIQAQPRRVLQVRDARFLVVFGLSAYVFHNGLTPDWLANVGHNLAGG